MAIIIKTQNEIERLRRGGPILARILHTVAQAVAPGITTQSLDDRAVALIKDAGCKPAFLGYKPEGADRPYPASLCVSVNDEVVHGIPSGRILKDGDIVSLDLGINYEGVFLDHAVTVPVGEISAKDKKMLSVAKSALAEGIEAIVMPKATTGDIGAAIESSITPHKFGIVRTLSGHGVGRAIHEDPYVPNFGKKGKGDKLKPGMVIAIEPMITRGSENVVLLDDGYTLVTDDHSRAAHFEHTVLITEKGAEILTEK
ncbi:MAG TPA: type I methionyl aminopeptidase [Candidatus Paceibacterota bacterium]|jgi:methionyl aminopeptidase|nr:type I methionyl aminopeptidase [Candidatus Paceibacterota bacterium]